MAFSTQGLRDWLGVVTDAYGSLSGFSDTTTIRHQLSTCYAWTAEYEQTGRTLTKELRAQEWDPVWAEDKAFIDNLTIELEGWLKQRGYQVEAQNGLTRVPQ